MDLDRIKEIVHTPAPAPLHVRLRDAIHAQITDGTLQPGVSLPSERILQQSLDVSRATVRQALSALIQVGLLQSVPGTGTFVMEPAKKDVATGLVGLVVSTPNFHFFYPQLAAAFNAVIRQSGYGLVMALHNERVAVLEEVVEELLAQNVIALAITPPRYGDVGNLVSMLRQRNIPLIFIGRPSPISLVDSVSTNNHRIGYEATRHLLELGHTHIMHIGLPEYSTGQDRAAGYVQAMEEAGLTPRIKAIDEPQRVAPSLLASSIPDTVEDHLVEPAYRAARECLEAGGCDDVTGVFCFSDLVGIGVYKALRDLNRRIPQDVALVSVDDLITVRHFEVPLTTFALPGQEIGRQGAELLLLRLQGGVYPPQNVLLNAPLIKRMSSGAI